MKYAHYVFKRKLEGIFIWPFICLGKIICSLKKKQKEYRIFFFFPFYHTGGAEKVHAQIAQSVGNSNCIIFFTRKSTDKTFLKDFRDTGCTIIDISRYTDNKWLYFMNLIYRGIISSHINNQTVQPIVFNGQCNFAYKLSPWLSSSIKQIELIHALNTFSYIRLPFIEFYRQSLTVSQEVMDKNLAVEKRIAAPIFLNRDFSFVESRIELPPQKVIKDFHARELKVLYVGRGTPDKRVHIAAMVAAQNSSPTIKFHFAGNVEHNIPAEHKSYCILHGDITDAAALNNLYNECHVLIVTSSTESGPLVVLEAMARGLAIVTTNVGFAPNYIENNVNGFKINPDLDEKDIITSIGTYIQELHNNRDLLKRMGELNTEIAFSNFGIDQFHEAYKAIFNKVERP